MDREGGQRTGRGKRQKGKAIEEWGKTWGRVIELPGGAEGVTGLRAFSNFSSSLFSLSRRATFSPRTAVISFDPAASRMTWIFLNCRLTSSRSPWREYGSSISCVKKMSSHLRQVNSLIDDSSLLNQWFVRNSSNWTTSLKLAFDFILPSCLCLHLVLRTNN